MSVSHLRVPARAVAVLVAVALALAALVSAVTAVSTARPAAAASYAKGPCGSKSGVTVIVDLTHFSGGHVVRRCYLGNPATGFSALKNAGLSPVHGTGQGQDGPYQYLCRISGKPTNTADTCTGFVLNAPYWGFYVGNGAKTAWTYAAEGVDTYNPPLKGVLGFAFGAGTTGDPNKMCVSYKNAIKPSWKGSGACSAA